MSKVISEEWRAIPGYEGLYVVSSLGRVKSLFRYKKVLKPRLSNAGYERVELFKNKTGRWFSVHRLVAMAFIPNSDNRPEVNHIDECKTNNRVDNLEWVTREENNSYGTRFARQRLHTDYSKRKVNTKNQIEKCSIKIRQFTQNGEFLKEWNSASEFCRVNGKSSVSIIRDCCNGKRKTAYGYIFKDITRLEE